MEQVIMAKDRAAALEVFEQIKYGEQAHIVSMESDEAQEDPESHE
jgi:hypothetical protein